MTVQYNVTVQRELDQIKEDKLSNQQFFLSLFPPNFYDNEIQMPIFSVFLSFCVTLNEMNKKYIYFPFFPCCSFLHPSCRDQREYGFDMEMVILSVEKEDGRGDFLLHLPKNTQTKTNTPKNDLICLFASFLH